MTIEMTGEEYRATLKSLGWSQGDVVRELEISYRSSNRYAKDGPPKVVALALRYMLTAPKKAAEIALAHKKARRAASKAARQAAKEQAAQAGA